MNKCPVADAALPFAAGVVAMPTVLLIGLTVPTVDMNEHSNTPSWEHKIVPFDE